MSQYLRVKLLKPINQLAARLMPGPMYVYLARLFIPLLDSNRRSSGVKVSRHGRLYLARGLGFQYYFFSPFNVGRYLYKEDYIAKKMLEKYSQSGVRVNKGDVVVDVGANVGEYSLAVSGIASKIIALEPDANHHKCLVLNAKGKTNIVCEDLALGDADGKKELFVASMNNDSSFIEPEYWRYKIEIKTVTLKTLMQRHNLSHIDFLKVEAEGYEPEILEASLPVLGFVRKVAVDGGPERSGKYTKDRCASILENAGFHVAMSGDIVFAKRS